MPAPRTESDGFRLFATFCSAKPVNASSEHSQLLVIYVNRPIPQNILKLSLGQKIDPEPLFSAMDLAVELGEAQKCYLFSETLYFLEASNDGSLGDLGLAWIVRASPDRTMTENRLATRPRAANLRCLSSIDWSHVRL